MRFMQALQDPCAEVMDRAGPTPPRPRLPPTTPDTRRQTPRPRTLYKDRRRDHEM